MDYLRQYKNFLYSYHVSEGLKTTAGILVPALLMGYFGLLQIGITLSLGAMCVGITDSPGPLRHRLNGMQACVAGIFITSLVAGLVAFSPLLVALLLFVCCFSFSMINIYGARAGAVGLASLLVMTLSLKTPDSLTDLIERAFYITSGGLWYMSFSVLLHNVRPYKLAQQALGDCIQSISEYLRLRAGFYDARVDYQTTYRKLLQQQASVQDKHNMVGELLFKTREIVKESTHTGRILIMAYLDIAEMFERIMTSYQDYRRLHEFFDETDILDQFKMQAHLLADELDRVAIAIKSGYPSVNHLNQLFEFINDTRHKLDGLRATHLKADNIDGFISLRRILENIEDLANRVKTMHQYTTYDRILSKKTLKKLDYSNFVSHQDISLRLLVDNLTLQSETFRHALRMSVAVLAGYLVSLLFTIGHSYWILLTIVVILKPAYSLTKQRNTDRLIGTIVGVMIGFVVLLLVENKTALLVIMIGLMTGSFIFWRSHYLLNVSLMTPYVIIFINLLDFGNFRNVFADRVIDTIIGSAIAFVASIFLLPVWERGKIKPLLINMVQQGIQYFTCISEMNIQNAHDASNNWPAKMQW